MDIDKMKLLAELVIEYHSNTNAAGEYDGKDPRLLYPNLCDDVLLKLAEDILNQGG